MNNNTQYYVEVFKDKAFCGETSLSPTHKWFGGSMPATFKSARSLYDGLVLEFPRLKYRIVNMNKRVIKKSYKGKLKLN